MPRKSKVHKVKKPKPRPERLPPPAPQRKDNPLRAAEFDLYSAIFLDDYESGRDAGGLKAWKEEHDRLTDRFYEGRPLPETLPPEELNQHLDEASFVSRERGRKAVKSGAVHLSMHLQSVNDLNETCLEIYEDMQPAEREEVVLEALADIARDRHANLSWQHKLMPELNLKQLTGGDGKGLGRLVSSFSEHLLDEDVVSHPFHNDLFFRKFGIVTNSSFPVSKAARAFAEEHVLIRESQLQRFVGTIFTYIHGINCSPRYVRIGQTAADLSAESAPHAAATATSPNIAAGLTNLNEECCSWCNRSASQADTSALKRCSSCLKVGRLTPYCSRSCQVADFAQHETSCGRLLSEAGVPFFQQEAQDARLSPLRRTILRILDDSPNETWAFGSDNLFGSLGHLNGSLDDPQTMRIRRSMRKIAYTALREDNLDCINILALLAVRPAPHKVEGPYERPYESPRRRCVSDLGYDHWPLVQKNFQEMFGFANEAEVDDAGERGRVALEKPEYAGAKELHETYEKIRADKILDEYLHLISQGGDPALAVLSTMMRALELSGRPLPF